jgi:hypothetical protein
MRMLVTIEGRDETAMSDLVRKHGIDVVGGSARRERGLRVDAVVDEQRVAELTDAGFAVQVVQDEKSALERRADIDWHPDDRPKVHTGPHHQHPLDPERLRDIDPGRDPRRPE